MLLIELNNFLVHHSATSGILWRVKWSAVQRYCNPLDSEQYRSLSTSLYCKKYDRVRRGMGGMRSAQFNQLTSAQRIRRIYL